MKAPRLSRRSALAALAAASVLPAGLARADRVIELGWSDLLPEGTLALPPELSGLVDHSSSTLAAQQPVSTGVRTDWNGQTVSLPGYIVPLEYEGTGVSAFILVPYVGACIHVPPPPANQLVLVTTDDPYESDGLFEAVEVVGEFGTTPTSTDLAQIGYVLVAEKVRPYG